MWFKSKPRNRRLGRERVLDVKLRSSKVRATRIRMAALALGAVFGTVFGLYLIWRTGGWALNNLVYENQAFAIRELDVQTDGVISVEQLRRWTGVKTGQNLLALDLARVKRNLELVPIIQSASIERILPRTLRIRVTEREPLAQINIPRPRATGGIEMAVFQIDAEGWVIAPLEIRQRTGSPPSADDLPVISGINPNDPQPGRRLETPQVQAALQLLIAFEGSPMSGRTDIKRIDVSAPETVTATTGQGSEITFSLTGFEQQLLRWQAIFETGLKRGQAIATLDLAIANNIPARWLEASEVPPATPHPPKTLNKKKHV
jgi:cell division septal protein FtsQ